MKIFDKDPVCNLKYSTIGAGTAFEFVDPGCDTGGIWLKTNYYKSENRTTFFSCVRLLDGDVFHPISDYLVRVIDAEVHVKKGF
jgi:hypothetical protein